MVEPERFLPLAQKTELIVPCEHWALRTLASEIAQWPGPLAGDLRFAVNVSAVHLRALHAERLLRGLEEMGEALGHRPELDFGELDQTNCPDRTLGLLERIADLGFPLALDRFGAGPVSLRSLKRLPLRRLKLDPLLIRDVERDPEAATVVAAIVDLAHAYGLSVLADGVETAGQIGFLQAHGCDEAQGIFKSPPVDADTFVALLA
jgi:EAL domain-containing protein (putative c-di-GMP-specific phosphodiesterase class I)